MRKIKQIIIHCSDSKVSSGHDIHDIRSWHREKGFNDVGYHYVILPDGTVQTGRPLDVMGAHCQGRNAESIGICYIGGKDEQGNHADTRTAEQREILRLLVKQLKERFPGVTVHGHREFNRQRDCPCFDVATQL